VPADWKNGVIIPLYKGKGSKADCSSYRPISLLSVPGKVFGLVFLGCLRPLLTAKRLPEQSGFTTDRSTANAILTLLLLSEIVYEFQHHLRVVYVDLKSAFDYVDRSALWLALKGVGTPNILFQLPPYRFRRTCCGRGECLRQILHDLGGAQRICVGNGLFFRAVAWRLDNMTCLRGIAVDNGKFTVLDYADEIVLPANTMAELAPCLTDFSLSVGSMGLNVTLTKTEVQCLGRAFPTSDLQVEGQVVESVNRFCYLVNVQDSNGRIGLDFLRRLGVATSSMSALSRVLSQKRLSLNMKLRICQTCILPIVLCRLETWTLLSKDTKRLQAFHMICQHRILGVVGMDRVRNMTVAETPCLPQISNIISRRRSALFGHVARLRE